MPKKTTKPDEEISLGQLEASLESLEALVEQLESGELPLEQAVKEFERGIKLTRQCQTVLKDAGKKVEILLEQAAEAEPFEVARDS
jgi:exodeoxyribonuclease VII small subunit